MKRQNFLKSLGVISGSLAMGHISNLYGLDSDFDRALKSSPNKDEYWRIIREQFVFPDDYTYLNTGGIGALPSLVINKVVKTINEQEKHPKPGHGAEAWEQVKHTCAPFFGPGCVADELALIGCATEGINIILNGLGLKAGDEIITSTHEHPAVHIPLLNHYRMNKIRIKTINPDLENGMGNVEKIGSLITKKTRLILLSHVTCTTGQIFPIKEIAELAHSKGILIAVDGAQAPGSILIDLKDINADFYTTSGHKWMLGPKRTGLLYVPERNLDILQPTTVGAYSDDGYDIGKMELKLQKTAQRYEFGTQNEPLFIGLGAGARFVSTIGLKRVQEHNRELALKFYEGLNQIENVVVLSPREEKYRSSMISFKIEGKKNQDISSYLSKASIRVRVVNEAGLNAVRVSFHVYNQEFEVEKILEKISEFAKS